MAHRSIDPFIRSESRGSRVCRKTVRNLQPLLDPVPIASPVRARANSAFSVPLPRKKVVDSREQPTEESCKRELFESAAGFDSLGGSASVAKELQNSPWCKYIVQSSSPQFVSIDDAKDIIFERMTIGNIEFISTMANVNGAKRDLKNVSRQIIECTSAGKDLLRQQMRFQIALFNHRLDFYEREAKEMSENISYYAHFRAFLEKLTSRDLSVDINSFLHNVLHLVPFHTRKFSKQEKQIRRQIGKALKLHRRNVSPEIAFFLPSSSTGRIISRLKTHVEKVDYCDLGVIATALLENSSDKNLFTRPELMDALFDLGWQVKPYPYSKDFTYFRLPSTSSIIPKVFNPGFLTEEWQMLSFDELAGKDWPLRPAVDYLFVIMILTNPFEIAGQFYLMIEEIGRCVQRILIQENQDTSFVELGFDQIFVLMILCVLACGIPDILAPMKWSYSFAGFLKTDPQKQYGMSHMEGLCTHLEGLDYRELKKLSWQLINAGDVGDPLGIMT